MLKGRLSITQRGDIFMKLTIESKGEFKKVNAWLAGVVNRSPVPELRRIASEGERSLANNTPKDTGETASGWVSQITTYRTNNVVEWMNVAHPEALVNIARIIDRGHGTGTGGYVPPRPYIVKSMDAVWNNSGDKLAKELFR